MTDLTLWLFLPLVFSAAWTPDSFRVAYLPSKWHNLVEMLGLNAARVSQEELHILTQELETRRKRQECSMSQFLRQGCRRRPGSLPHRYSMKKILQGTWICWTGKCGQSLWQEVFSSPDCSTNDALETDILLSHDTQAFSLAMLRSKPSRPLRRTGTWPLHRELVDHHCVLSVALSRSSTFVPRRKTFPF